MNNVQINHTRRGLMVGILILHLEKSGLSDSPIRSMWYTWRRINPTPETPFIHSQQKIKKTSKLKSHTIFDHVPHIYFLPSLSKTSNYSSDLYNFNYTQGTHTISFSCSNAIYLANFNFIQYLRFSHDHV